MHYLGTEMGVLANRADDQLHEFTGCGVYDLSLLVKVLTDRLDILSNDELQGLVDDYLHICVLRLGVADPGSLLSLSWQV